MGTCETGAVKSTIVLTHHRFGISDLLFVTTVAHTDAGDWARVRHRRCHLDE